MYEINPASVKAIIFQDKNVNAMDSDASSVHQQPMNWLCWINDYVYHVCHYPFQIHYYSMEKW